MAETMSDVFDVRAGARGGTATPVLHVVLRGGAPLDESSRHSLRGIDVVSFARGDRKVSRVVRGGLHHLLLTIPDPMMSSDHGRLLCARERWMLDDPASKNGAIVAGKRTRTAALELGTAFALGHTVFLIDQCALDAGARADLLAGELKPPLPELATFHPGFQAAIDVVARVATSELPVLILGETGTGKEIIARALHELSQRRGAFVAVNCGAIAGSLVESELFGHRKGAFSGALAERLGHVRSADRGTLFLDEIAELPPAAQAALLRVLQEREVVPVGDSMPVSVDFRLGAATHRDLGAMVAAGTFREDLHARLMGAAIRVPPLRERRGDLGLLVRSLLRRHADGPRVRLSPAAALALVEHTWPRNVRELAQTLAVAVTLAGGDVIDLPHLPDLGETEAAPGGPAATPAALSPEDAALKDELVRMLAANEGNVAEVARLLGKDRTQLYRWIRRFGIVTPGRSPRPR